MKTLLKILLLFALAFGITLLVLKWKSRQEGLVVVLSPIEIAEAREVVERLESEARQGNVRLDASTLRRLLMASLADSKSGRVVLDNSVGVRASIGDGKIEAGVVLSTAGLAEKLEGGQDEKLDRLASILEWLPGDGVFVGARGVPVVRDGALSIDTATLELQLGPLRVTPEELADKINLSSERLAGELTLRVDDVILESARVEGETLVLRTREGPGA
jgi:hypothetical protein